MCGSDSSASGAAVLTPLVPPLCASPRRRRALGGRSQDAPPTPPPPCLRTLSRLGEHHHPHVVTFGKPRRAQGRGDELRAEVHLDSEPDSATFQLRDLNLGPCSSLSGCLRSQGRTGTRAAGLPHLCPRLPQPGTGGWGGTGGGGARSTCFRFPIRATV